MLSAWLEPGQLQMARAGRWPVVAAVIVSAVVVSRGGHTACVTLLQRYGAIPFQAWVGWSSIFPMLSAWLDPGQPQMARAGGWPLVAAVLFSPVVVSLGAHTAYVTLLQRYEANLISALILVTPLATIALGVT